MKQYFIIGNFGNHSLAAMQALIEKQVEALHFIYVETGWAATLWTERVVACSEYAQRQGVQVHCIPAKPSFSAMVCDRKQFPNLKFQWCASFLKALPLLHCLDELDSFCEALVVLGKRQLDSRRYAYLQEFEYNNEFYQGRTIWYPLWQTSNEALMQFIERTGFKILDHSSLECSPCVHASKNELNRLDSTCVQRLSQLEQFLGKTMFLQPIAAFVEPAIKSSDLNETRTFGLQQFDRGCGGPWGCGE